MARPDPASARIIDASLNRAAEGLRVVEDICRFNWELPGLQRELKEIRHAALNAFAPTGEARSLLAAERDIEEDVGRSLAVAPGARLELSDVAVKNLARAKEALRSLEEVGRILDRDAAGRIAALRYRLYSVEKGILALAARRGPTLLGGARLYLVACPGLGPVPLPEAVQAALAGGAGAVQLRGKGLPDRDLLALGRALREATAGRGVPFIVNDRPDIASLLGADGVHLGQEDLPVAHARRILGEGRVVGVSTHSVEEARRAAREGADYLGAGPVFATGTKAVGKLLGPEGLRPILEATELPVFAIGGVRRENARLLAAAGARRAAVSSGILAEETPGRIEAAARDIASALGTA